LRRKKAVKRDREEYNYILRLPFPNSLEDRAQIQFVGSHGTISSKVERGIGKLLGGVENLGLMYDKFVPIFKRIDSQEDWLISKESIKKFPDLAMWRGIREILQKLNERLDNEKESLEKEGYSCVYDGIFETKSRLVIGLGSQSVLETSLTLHKVWGIPYIPATALKGAMRMVAFWRNNGEEDKNTQYLFGTTEQKGLLIFLDAYPLEFKFDLDIVNIHYPEYYRGQVDKAEDYEVPTLVYFVTVSKGSKFRVVVLMDDVRYEKNKGGIEYSKEKIAEVINELISYAFEEFGVGAKTRLGYGVLKKDRSHQSTGK
jgi:CRISPR-associated protein Cmr6